MENLIREADTVELQKPRRSWRALSVFAAVALVLGGMALARGADDGLPKTDVVTNIEDGRAVVDGAGAQLGRTLGFGAPAAQINIGSFVCPILQSLANAFRGTAFGSLVLGILGNVGALFGCNIS